MGYPPGARGILTSGGSLSNLTAIVTAREREARRRSRARRALRLVRDAPLRGEGRAHRGPPARVVRARSRSTTRLRMRPAALEEAIRADHAPRAAARSWWSRASAPRTPARSTRCRRSSDDRAARTASGSTPTPPTAASSGSTAEGPALMPRPRGVRLDHARPAQGAVPALRHGLPAGARRRGAAPRPRHGRVLPAGRGGRDGPGFTDLSPELSRDFRGLRLWLPIQLHGLRPFRDALAGEARPRALGLRAAARTTPLFEIVDEPQLSVVAFRLRARAASATRATPSCCAASTRAAACSSRARGSAAATCCGSACSPSAPTRTGSRTPCRRCARRPGRWPGPA